MGRARPMYQLARLQWRCWWLANGRKPYQGGPFLFLYMDLRFELGVWSLSVCIMCVCVCIEIEVERPPSYRREIMTRSRKLEETRNCWPVKIHGRSSIGRSKCPKSPDISIRKCVYVCHQFLCTTRHPSNTLAHLISRSWLPHSWVRKRTLNKGWGGFFFP